MADCTSIADVGETLVELLRDKMKDFINNPVSIFLASPGEIDDKDFPCLCLFLYQVRESTQLKNQPARNQTRRTSTHLPSLVLDLYYMLTAYGSNHISDKTERAIAEHKILGRAMNVMYDYPVLGDSLLKGSLAGSGENLKVIPYPMSLDEINKLWSCFPENHINFQLIMRFLRSR